MADELFDVERRSPGPEGAGDQGEADETILLRLHVRPGAGRGAVAGRYGDALHVRVAPPPADGRANDAVVALVADLLDVAPSRIELVSGHKSRQKRLRVTGVKLGAVRTAIGEAVDRSGATSGGKARGRGGRGGR